MIGSKVMVILRKREAECRFTYWGKRTMINVEREYKQVASKVDIAVVKELARRLDHYEKLHAFVIELAEWNATCDSWYQLFVNFQDKAQKVLR